MKQLLFVCLFIAGALATASAQPKKGEQAPAVAIPNVQGKLVNLADLKGKVVLVDFWASWCGPCRKAMPGLRKAYEAYKGKGFEIYGISLDEDKKAWKKAMTADQITWIQVNEPGGWEGKTAVAWNIEQLPSAFLLDKQGKVIAIDPTEAELNKLLQSNL